jgi:hypothetical protein
LLACPETVTTTVSGPATAGVAAPVVIAVSVHVLGVTAVPLKVTVLEPCVAPKVVPLIVNNVPRGPVVGETLVIFGVTVNVTPLLDRPATVTITDPVVAPEGTVATMLVSLQLAAVAAIPLNLTVLVPWLVPNPEPAIVTEVPTGPLVGERLVMDGPRAKTSPTWIKLSRKTAMMRSIVRAKVDTSRFGFSA